MRVWEKNYLYTLLLFTALFYICIFIIAASSFSSVFTAQRDAALREESMIAGSFQRDIVSLGSNANMTEQAVVSKFAGYASYYRERGLALALYSGGRRLYGSLPTEPQNDVLEGARSCSMVSSGGAKYLRVNDLLSGPDKEYTLLFLKDISGVYLSLRGQTAFLIAVGAAVTVIFAAGLYFTLKRVYRPVGNLAHELRTPLTSIRGYAEYIQAAAATEEERYSAATYIIEESKRLSDVCDKLLILANLREGDILFEKVDIAALFESAKMTYKNVEYDVQTQYVRGNKTLLQSMINNLVSNALKASPEGRPVMLKAYDNMIEVTDYGFGMDAELLARVSKASYEPGISVKNKSSGLGIPLCHRIARLHGAQLAFSSEPGKGTTATITFTTP
jgi:hypothetical protein